MRHLHSLAALSVFAFCSTVFADQVVLKNGDRLTGNVTKSDGKTLTIKTEFAGDVNIDWSAVQEITSTQPLHVEMQTGKTVAGPVTTSDGNLAVSTTSGGIVSVPKAEITALRNDQEQTVYASNDTPGALPATTANTTQAGARYDHNLTPRLFGFVGADFQTDALQLLNLRSVLGGGLGVHVINSSQTTLDLLGGLNYTRESYVGFNRNFAALTLGEEFMHKIGISTVLTEKGYFFPDLSQTGEYRATFNFGTVTKLNKWLGWQNAFGNIYVTNPPFGKKKNDILLTSGLNVSFTH